MPLAALALPKNLAARKAGYTDVAAADTPLHH